MKTFCGLFLVLFFSSACMQNHEIVPDESAVIGAWSGEDVEIRSLTSGKIVQGYPPILVIGDNKIFYKNYWYGDWQLSGDQLILQPKLLDSTLSVWEFKITDFSSQTLVLERRCIKGEHSCFNNQFEDGEESYVRYQE